ncbi:LacI family DNA-binding transcriptional regulator [Nocardioides mesophilus]|uniref:LacI family DNA-binding transcriptional regulator n=1 Tax=Nocardioides mesophilus TaxID=433659 RepID=A0A7G9RFD5_9ACTN|nr:LacI family DNA-binding transcriptional regulator [Nocardioides mesophilus]QNN54310.1 LacI family DNA-binding transcriptional regulator [Nocardioides mesophilus]
MATMIDVALRAGVSTTTVSHVLNESRYVAEATRQKVLTAIEETGYTHNTVARSLATSSTRTIGLAISAISNPYFIDLVRALESEVRAAGYLMLLVDTMDDPDEELRVIRSLHSRRVDGYVLAPSADPERRALRYLADQRLPTVLIDRLASESFDQVGVENEHATSQLVEHVASLGHRRIALICGQPGLSTTNERLSGYQLGLERSGLAYDAELVASGASEVEPARVAVRELIALAEPPTAIVAANNRMTIGVLEGLQDLGMRVPDDIALVSFDDFEWAHLFHPRLTVISQPIARIGAEAARLLLARLKDPTRPTETIQLTPEFVHRESCGCSSSR